VKLKSNYAAPAFLILLSALVIVSGLLEKRLAGDATASALSAIVLYGVIFLIPAVLYCYARGASFVPRLRLRFFTGRHIILILLGSVFLISGATAVSAFLCNRFPEAYAASAPMANPLYVMDGTFIGTLRTLLAFALAPSLCEELVFRGIVAAEYETFGTGAAVMMSSLTFAMIHFSFVRLPIYLFGGLVLSLVLYASRSVFASWIVHFLYNAFVLLADIHMRRFISGSDGYILLTFGMTLVALVSGFFLFYEAQKLYKHYGETNVPASYIPRGKRGGSEQFVSVVAAPPFLLLVLLYIVLAAVA